MKSLPEFGTRLPDRDYVPRQAAYAIIRDGDGRIAFVQEKSGLFLPGGGIEPGENAITAIHREIQEECGRHFRVARKVGDAVQYFVAGDGRTIVMDATFFLGEFGAETGTPPELEMHWIPITGNAPVLYHACHRWAIEQARLEIEGAF